MKYELSWPSWREKILVNAVIFCVRASATMMFKSMGSSDGSNAGERSEFVLEQSQSDGFLGYTVQQSRAGYVCLSGSVV